MKRWISGLIAAVLVLGLCACGEKAPTWQEQYDLGMRYLSDGNYEEAIIAFTAAIEIDPKRAPAYVGRGDAYVGQGEAEENLAAARLDYEQAIEIDNTYAEAYLGLAETYICIGDYARGMEILQQGLKKTGNNAEIAERIAAVEELIASNKRKLVRTETYITGTDGTMIESYTVYSYDEHGNQIRVSRYENGNISYENEYDENGNITRNSSYDDNGNLYSYSISEYDAHGNKIKDSSFDRNGNLKREGTWEYDSTGNLLVENWELLEDGTSAIITTRHEYEFDKSGNCIRHSQKWEFDAIVSLLLDLEETTVNEYNDANQVVKSTIITTSGSIGETGEIEPLGTFETIVIYEYDEGGHLVRETETQSSEGFDSYVTVVEYEYDKDGRLLLETSHGNAYGINGASTTEYRYDEFGDRVEIVLSSNGELGSYTSRTLYFYED